MSMSAVLGRGRAVNSGILALRSSFRSIFTYRMADKPVDYTNSNGIESKTPFLIGVAGGTASGKVPNLVFFSSRFIDFSSSFHDYVRRQSG